MTTLLSEYDIRILWCLYVVKINPVSHTHTMGSGTFLLVPSTFLMITPIHLK